MTSRALALLLLGGALPIGRLAAQASPSASTAPSVGNPTSNVPPNLLTYSLTASGSAIFGYNGVGGNSGSMNVAGNAGWVSGSESHPTSFIYSGGYLFGFGGQNSSSFQNLGVSQVLRTTRWTLLGSDLISYLPATPRYGLSGVPGVGDTGTLPVGAGVLPGEALLSNYGRRLTNTAIGSASYQATGRTSIRSSGTLTNQFFLDGNGYDNNQVSASLQVDHLITRKTTIGGGYNFGRFTYPTSNLGFNSHSFVAVYEHTFRPEFSFSASAGPQWTVSSQPGLIPTRLGISANLSLFYTLGRNSYTVTYARGTSAGSGVLLGAGSDTLYATAQRRLSENWTGSLFGSYGHVNSLTDVANLYTSANSFALGAQGSRKLGEHWSAFGSYSLQVQSVGQVAATRNAFTGTGHLVSVGITYAPQPVRLGRR